MIIGVSGKIGSGKDTVGKIIQYLTDKNRAGYTNPDSERDYNDYCKSIFKGKANWQIKKFADKLKECISIITGISREDLEKEEIKSSMLGEEWAYYSILNTGENKYERFSYTKEYSFPSLPYKFPVRQLLQEFGTEVGRQIHPNFWVNALFNEYKAIIDNTKIDWKNQDKANKSIKENLIYPNWIITDVRFPNELKAVKDRDGITIRCNRDIENWGDAIKQITNDKHPSETALDNATFNYTIDNNGTIEELIEKVKEILIKEKII